ncbi:hypothetical protein DFH09DRAFT_1306403 [Mycena vulgaris]|nr:hypothetical protein DFH09DRAFT_1306403 [Mycena vulgaris]
MNIFRAVESKVNFSAVAVIEGARDGLKHLHSPGYAHNDVNPANIALNEDSLPVIIDFDSCHPIGESLKGKKAGTMGWDHEGVISEAKNDFFGLDKVESWLQEKAVASS